MVLVAGVLCVAEKPSLAASIAWANRSCWAREGQAALGPKKALLGDLQQTHFVFCKKFPIGTGAAGRAACVVAEMSYLEQAVRTKAVRPPPRAIRSDHSICSDRGSTS